MRGHLNAGFVDWTKKRKLVNHGKMDDKKKHEGLRSAIDLKLAAMGFNKLITASPFIWLRVFLFSFAMALNRFKECCYGYFQFKLSN